MTRSRLMARVAAFAMTIGLCLAGAATSTTAIAATKAASPAAASAPAAPTAPAAATAPAATAGSAGTIVGGPSGLCLGDSGGSTTLKTTADIDTCDGSAAQSWTASGGTLVDGNGLCLSVTGASTAPKATAEVYTCNGSVSENWTVESNGTIVNDNSGLCLSVVGSATTTGSIADIYTCNGSASENWTISTGSSPPSTPNFGSNVYVFNTSMSTTTIQNDINAVYATQKSNQFGTQRYELMFEPGTYDVTVPVGFYTEVVGLGQKPTQTVITGGGIYTDASWNGGNATENFWRDVENITIDPSSGSTEWAASQAAPLRRVQIDGKAVLADNNGWASGGFIADSVVTGQVNAETQQQYISRNDQYGSWTGSNWNMVFVGDTGVPGTSFPNPPDTTVSNTPAVAEKPYVYVDSSGNWDVFVPSDESNSQGTTWANGNTPGTSLPLSDFFIATPSDTVSDINNALAAGKDLLFTPGVYQIDGTIQVNNPDTVVLGLGLATLVSNGGNTVLSTADVNGIRIGGLLFDAGTTNSAELVQIGPAGSSADHSADPTILSDVFARIGGATVGQASESLVINSNNVIGDDLWLWRADHGNSGTVGWTTNVAPNGLAVNGANVTIYGLAVEHYQHIQTQWNGNGGAVYFYQSEMPYDPPNQASWMNGSADGYASLNVHSTVTDFQAYGLGVYCLFTDTSIQSANAITAPNTSGVQFHSMVTISLGNGAGGIIDNIINGTGGRVGPGTTKEDLASYN
ncbi:ricin-type beta-trefoil lectin domain protein [Streptomyces sp. SL13]|uniref:Ricin-type beta-trefoil lectin domain protein n=1 Tax=Streptantibioticus silvisoli TaxID=2705255 RepID=A0AA90H326_9ACTN|nr:ricin-type beta-trefoil lectin domain protein [Streptantibioticus silvisoli]MDI5970088.1 ricin-type beta-trefoil lectin domain protein [Streptantibioticus silvisoli]